MSRSIIALSVLELVSYFLFKNPIKIKGEGLQDGGYKIAVSNEYMGIKYCIPLVLGIIVNCIPGIVAVEAPNDQFCPKRHRYYALWGQINGYRRSVVLDPQSDKPN